MLISRRIPSLALLLVLAALAPAQEQSPDESISQPQKESPQNPGRSFPAQVVQAPVRMGKIALKHARTWETNWFTGVYVEEGQTMMPLTLSARRELYLEQTLTTPGAYLKRMLAAGIDQARDAPPQWGQGWNAFGARFASREGQFISDNTIAAATNAALGYEPRYDQCQCSGFWPRTRHAILRNFLTYNHGERDLRPQWGLYAGAFSGGLIASTWKPEPRSPWADAGYAVLGQAGYGSLLNFVVEFAGDINRKIGLGKNGRLKKSP